MTLSEKLNRVFILYRLYGLCLLLVKAARHIRARGLKTTILEIYAALFQRVFKLVLLVPSVRKKVEGELNKAKLDIETKLVPQGEHVIRHLSLPEKGLSMQQILAEMEKMDTESSNSSDWRHGKLSGAVYRELSCV